MSSVNVKLPAGLEKEMKGYIEEAGLHMNSSELVRDALREYLAKHQLRLSDHAHERIRQATQDMKAGRVHPGDDVKERLGLSEDDLDAARAKEDY